MSNAVYCKTIENVRNRIDVEFVSNKKDFLKRTSKPSFMSYKIFDNGLIAFTYVKALTKSPYIEMCI